MLPDPIHPAIVHLPIALAVLLPFFTLVGLVAIQTKALPQRAWAGVVFLGLILVLTSWMALETGEQDEERVEKVVAEQVIEEHEEAAEGFMVLGAVLFFVTMAGLAPGKAGLLARGASVVLALGVLASGIQVGHRGGALVYEHGAALAYSDGGLVGGSNAEHRTGEEHHEDDDD